MHQAIALTALFIVRSGLVVSAVVSLLWAVFARRGRRFPALLAVCLWCAVAGGTLSSALWGAMTEANAQFQLSKIARLPAGARAQEVDLQPMKMLQFFVSLERFGRRWGYVTVILPLAGSVWLLSHASDTDAHAKDDKPAPDDEFFRPG